MPTSLLLLDGWRQTARKPWSTRSRANVEVWATRAGVGYRLTGSHGS